MNTNSSNQMINGVTPDPGGDQENKILVSDNHNISSENNNNNSQTSHQVQNQVQLQQQQAAAQIAAQNAYYSGLYGKDVIIKSFFLW